MMCVARWESELLIRLGKRIKYLNVKKCFCLLPQKSLAKMSAPGVGVGVCICVCVSVYVCVMCVHTCVS